ncbi:helix-turn-helix domain-containing protein [Leptolyngbya sp. FACHB-16]|uniref:helix-turn-helix domain-containing protein n=1 Tax=unclassified Leptolyngbya TaxID=2650499 RepID=UPI00168A22B7|nr:helix-turn-helix domain-containing protein [Leptolyngbya sp. FACHB-16]MBD2158784.1 helix-turn-helix domain-containing protein [Leptolyngbya sp. FACHB-16]
MRGRPFRVTVSESLEQLEKSLQKARTVSQKEHLQMLVWLKQGVVSSRGELAERCQRNNSTITRWLTRYQQGELKELLATRHAPGATPKIQGEALEKLKARLAQAEGFHSYSEIQQWLEQTCQLTVEYGTLYRVVRYELKAKPKVPRPRALKQESAKLDGFKKKLP